MKHLRKSVLFLIPLIIIALLLDYQFSQILRNSGHDDFFIWTRAVEGEASSEVVVVGSSRALVHYDCSTIITDSNYNSCINLGLNGSGITLQRTIYDTHFTYNDDAELIIINLDPYTLTSGFGSNDSIYNAYQYTPYLNEDTIYPTLFEHDTSYWALKYIPLADFVTYEHNRDIIAKDIKGDEQLRRRDEYGFRYTDVEWDGKFDEFAKDNPEGIEPALHDYLVDQLQDMVNRAKEDGKRVVLVYSPEYYEAHRYFNNREDRQQIYSDVAEANNIEFIDYSESYLSKNKDNFYNATHLKGPAAVEFTEQLTRDLKLN